MLSKAIEATFENIAILRSLIDEGKVRALGAQNKTRTALVPDMSTMAEAGCRMPKPTPSSVSQRRPVRPPGIIKKIGDALNEGLAIRRN